MENRHIYELHLFFLKYHTPCHVTPCHNLYFVIIIPFSKIASLPKLTSMARNDTAMEIMQVKIHNQLGQAKLHKKSIPSLGLEM